MPVLPLCAIPAPDEAWTGHLTSFVPVYGARNRPTTQEQQPCRDLEKPAANMRFLRVLGKMTIKRPIAVACRLAAGHKSSNWAALLSIALRSTNRYESVEQTQIANCILIPS